MAFPTSQIADHKYVIKCKCAMTRECILQVQELIHYKSKVVFFFFSHFLLTPLPHVILGKVAVAIYVAQIPCFKMQCNHLMR